jgi:NADH-quinone oxidoreductase subunit H
MCAVVPVMLAGSMDPVYLCDRQAGLFTNWYVFHDPFTFIVFWIYCTCATASVNRAPFDLAEAESELVAGFHTEYSGLRWSFFFMAEYGSMLAVSLLASILFLGGWHGPIPVASIIGLTEGGWLHATLGAGMATYLANLIGMLNILAKGFLGVTIMMWIRWTLPRLRIDQVMTTCLKYCVPIAAVMFLGVTVWQLTLGQSLAQLYAKVPVIGVNTVPASITTLREAWPEPTTIEAQPEPESEIAAAGGSRGISR